MTTGRLFAVFVIFVAAALAWSALAASVDYRTRDADNDLVGKVGALWGQPQEQHAPSFRYVDRKNGPVLLGSTIDAKLGLDQRRKGLLWYATYAVDFAGSYRLSNGTRSSRPVTMRLPLPVSNGIYDGFRVAVDGKAVPVAYESDGVATATFEMPAGSSAVVTTGYRSQGMDRWSYMPNPAGVGEVRDFALTMRTDFADVDFPDGAVSPTSKERTGDGWALTWRYDNLVSGRSIGLEMPRPLNPGPVASRITMFAPVSLLFYFAALVLLTATRRARLHPMHYAFLGAGFFAFHLLFAYLVDRIDLTLSFGIAAVASIALCIGYLSMVLRDRRVVAETAASQAVFLVLFSYTFFFEGLTGLAIAVGSVLTLGYFMVRTAGIDWEEAFARRGHTTGVPIGGDAAFGPPAPPAPPAPATT